MAEKAPSGTGSGLQTPEKSVPPAKLTVASTDTEPATPVSITGAVSVIDFAYSPNTPMYYGIYEEEDDLDDDDDYDDDDEEDDDIGYGTTKGQLQYGRRLGEAVGVAGSGTGLGTGVDSDEQGGVGGTDAGEEGFEAQQAEGDPVQAVAIYPFEPENENELRLVTDQIVVIEYEYGDGWLVAYDPQTKETGLVPSGYVQIVEGEIEFAAEVLDQEETSGATQYLPEMLRGEPRDAGEAGDAGEEAGTSDDATEEATRAAHDDGETSAEEELADELIVESTEAMALARDIQSLDI